MKKMGLRAKLLTLFLLMGLIPALLISIYSYLNSRKLLTDQIYSQFESINHNKMNAINSYITRIKQDIDVFSKSEDVQESFAMLKTYHDKMNTAPDQDLNVKSAENQQNMTKYGKLSMIIWVNLFQSMATMMFLLFVPLTAMFFLLKVENLILGPMWESL